MQRIGRWASPDPLAVHAMGGGEGLNSYHYVSGNLLQARDPLGLDPGGDPGAVKGSAEQKAASREIGRTEAAFRGESEHRAWVLNRIEQCTPDGADVTDAQLRDWSISVRRTSMGRVFVSNYEPNLPPQDAEAARAYFGQLAQSRQALEARDNVARVAGAAALGVGIVYAGTHVLAGSRSSGARDPHRSQLGAVVLPKTPTDKLRAWVNRKNTYLDPVTNILKTTTKTLAADHVYPKDLIKALDGFDALTTEQKDFLLNNPDNIEPLPREWNSSKRDRLADDWAKTPMGRTASPDYVNDLRARQQSFEAFAKEMIDFFSDQNRGSK